MTIDMCDSCPNPGITNAVRPLPGDPETDVKSFLLIIVGFDARGENLSIL